MYNYLGYDYKEAQRQYEERIREAQACHAEQRQMLQALAQAVNWLGGRLIAWSERVQMRQALTLHDSHYR
ncbi:MAG: hypothetical protein DYG89_09285 [Caldilinea sp. CFX5]|nr:hypothetical protein [Caldilinea sp. CFX5]